ncbi:glycosyl transferase family 1 [Methylocystis bryophila]|uniref:Glycosyl transferase family 1 n=1 Tax=Methylocystis bryophila TaxID=655015 RepID=A0A1W6N170_9HYPH|nr:glycosyl transferase family 1 [Methylocystis bryophila]
MAAPLSGKTVAVVHAAWHSCGSCQVNRSQLEAYKALGARTISVAMMDVMTPPAPQGGRWPEYIAATPELVADARYFTGPPRESLWKSPLLRDGWWPLIHGDQATWLVELAKRAPVPEGLAREKIDLVHANHYFTIPLARKLGCGKSPPIILETQDIQARQYVLRNRGGFFIPPFARYEDMLAVELYWTQKADLCAHINAEEREEFVRLLPRSRHALIYPAVQPAPLALKPAEIAIVASDNYANFVSLRWFLQEVLPLAGPVPVAVYGNIDEGVKTRDKALYEARRELFRGRVSDIGAVYERAAAILLPTVEGHGLSIKAVEALSSGAPLIATRQAFRGMGVDPATLANVTLRDDASAFAAALRERWQELAGGTAQPARPDAATRQLYEASFSAGAYARALAREVAPLLNP